jgi:hypothetical protein
MLLLEATAEAVVAVVLTTKQAERHQGQILLPEALGLNQALLFIWAVVAVGRREIPEQMQMPALLEPLVMVVLDIR